MNFLQLSLTQLLYQSPMLLAYLAAMIYCGVRWNRAALPATLTIMGTALMLFSTLSSTIVTNYMIANRTQGSSAQWTMILGLASLAFTIVRTVGFVMIVIAVFAQRRPEEQRGFSVQPVETIGNFRQ